jgi:hypothetical protein
LRQLQSASCGLYIFVDRPRLVSDLQEFLLDAGFIAAQRRGDGLEVSIPGSSDTRQARRVVNVYLTIWRAIHPGVRAFHGRGRPPAVARRLGQRLGLSAELRVDERHAPIE